MTALVSFLLFCQALGAVIGISMTIWGELSYVKAVRDGRVDAGELAPLHSIARALRYGMTLLLTASFALVVSAYLTHAAPQPALTSSYWTLIVVALLTVISTWALSRKHLSFALGSTIAFTAWWFLGYLTAGWLPPLSFGAATGFLVVATGIFYGMLAYARMLAHPKVTQHL